MITNFINHLIDFIKKNTWVLAVYLFIMTLLFILPSNRDKDLTILNAIITSSLHFVGDIFIMMTLDEYQVDNRKAGSRFQLTATIIFTIAKLYCALLEGTWQYLLTDPAFIISAIKGYRIDIERKNFLINRSWKFIILCTFCFIACLISTLEPSYFNITPQSPFLNLLDIILVIGLLVFAYSLFVSDVKKVSNVFGIIGLSLIVTCSGLRVINLLITKQMPAGLDISYFLLPLVVLIHKVKGLAENNIVKRIIGRNHFRI